MSTQNDTFWPKVGKMEVGVGEMEVGGQVPICRDEVYGIIR